MVQFENKSGENVSQRIECFRKTHEIVLSNYYGLKNEIGYECCELSNTFIVRVKEHSYYRLFFIASDEEELITALSQLQGFDYVFNIPTRESIEDKVKLFEKAGFGLIGVYDRYYNNNIQEAYEKLCKLTENIAVSDNMEVAQLASESEINDIWLLLSETFSLYMDHIPSIEELLVIIRQGHCYVNRFEGKVCGVNIISPKKQILYDNCRVDKKGLGPFLSKNMVCYALDNGIKVINYWIARDNKMIIKYHRIMGAVADGLSDYSFLKTK